MGTTVWVDDETRKALRRLQRDLGAASANDTIRRLIERPSLDARTLFALHRDAIAALLARHKVKRLVAFGSRARGDADPASDLDVAVEMGRGADALAPLALEADLEDLLGMPVNVVDLPNPRLASALRAEGVPFAA
jgi:predicted nucleotidyltransferase